MKRCNRTNDNKATWDLIGLILMLVSALVFCGFIAFMYVHDAKITLAHDVAIHSIGK